jgi:pectinesterase
VKKIVTLFVFLFLGTILMACENPSVDYDSLIKQDLISIPSEVTENITLPTSVEVEGKTFNIVWTSNQPTVLSETGTVNRPSHTLGDVSVTLTAVVTKDQFNKTLNYIVIVKALPIPSYTVTFNTNGGTTINPQTVNLGAKVNAPLDPTKSGFTFAGWFKEENLTTPWVFNTDTVTTNVTLYAKWEVTPDVYTVTFEQHDGSTLTTSQVTEGNLVIKPENDPVKQGYTFIEWQLNQVAFDFSQTIINQDIVLKPKFEITNYTISYWKPVDATIVLMGDDTYTIESQPVFRTIEMTGMIFVGWFTRPEGGTLVESIPLGSTGNYELYGRFEPDSSLPTGTLLYTPQDVLDLITNGATGQVHLMNDIDMTGTTLTGSAKTFDGILDGHGFTIRGAVINASGNKMGFLFKEVLNGGVIKNINFADAIHNGGGTSESSAFISAFAQGGSRFENIAFYNVSVIHAGSYAALLFGDVINDATETTISIRNITVINDENHWIEGSSYVGGLIGAARKAVTIDVENVYFDSKVAAPNQAAGAIMGRLNAAGITLTVRQIVIKGSISSGKNVGAILGTNISGSTLIADKVFISDITQTSGTNTNRIGVGNLPSGSTATLTNLYYASETTIFMVGPAPIAIPEGTGLTTSQITQTWFDQSGFNSTYFKYFNGSITRQSEDSGPVVETGFSISTSQVKKYYLAGEDFDITNLAVYATFSDGSSTLLEANLYQIDSTLFDNTKDGEYDISITYNGQTKVFSVKVVSVSHVLADDLLMKQTYGVGSTFNADGLVVKAVLTDGTFIKLNPNEYTLDLSQVNFNITGDYQASITYKTFEVVHINIYVHTIDVSNQTAVSIYVDQTFLGYDSEIINNHIMFKTVKSALQYLVNQNYPSTTLKHLYLMAGTYREKVTITVPNLIMIGEDEATTIITYNAASGTQQPNGSTWGTQGSATVSIKSSATGFMAKNITFQNDFNFNQSTIADKQGVALVNEADQVIFYQVSFKGYQDTLYAKSGRQYYLDVYIEGVVDFIFGNGGPAFFENSEIRSLARSTGVISTNKGYNTQNTLLISFGYVFYNNTFTFEQGVPAGSVDLGRPWDKSAAIMYIQNTFGEHISSRGWTEMSGNFPQDARFYEYENKDTNQQLLPTTTNGKTLSSELVSSVIDKTVVFGVNNGLVTFSSEWFYQNALTYLQSLT